MSFLQGPSILRHIGFNYDDEESCSVPAGKLQGQKTIRPASSLANLVHIVRNPVENVGDVVVQWYSGSTKEERTRRQILEDRKQLLYLRMRTANNRTDWEAAAMELDGIEGNNEWKAIFDSPDYDASLVQARLKQLDEARISCDVGRMLFLIRTALTRDLGDMGNLRLYKYTHVGTKDLIERYITSALETLDALLDVSAKAKCDEMESRYILEQVLFARQAFGRSALLLSGGGTFGMSHIGVLKALWEANMMPRIISGASAGSIVCATFGTRTDEEIPQLLTTFSEGDLAVFEEESNQDGLLRKAARFLKHGALYDISHLTRVMRELLGDMTFQEAYNRTRKILNICVSSASLYELPRLLNYITAPNVLIWSAVTASCSVPCIYTAAALLAKDPKTGEARPWDPSPQRWVDGSVDNDIPVTRLAEMFNVNHFIVSQVNPHVVPFLIKEEDAIGQEVKRSTCMAASGPPWLHSLSHLAKGEAVHRMRTLIDLGIFPNILTKTVSVLSQKYSGDITIFPEISYADFPRILSNPTREFMQHAMMSGERATWPKMSIIKNHCAIELALDDTVQKLRARVAFSPSEVELRIGKRTARTINPVKGTRGNHRRTRRLNSQNSASSVATMSSPSLHTRTQHSSARLAPTLRHKKSISLETAILNPSPPLLNPGPPRANTDLPQSKNSHDVTSSGAEELADETSNLPSSSTSTSVSSPTYSPSFSAEREPHYRSNLFSSSSQPTTPSFYPSYSLADTLPVRPKAGISSFSMTPSKSTVHMASSASEPRSKRLSQDKTQRQTNVSLSSHNRRPSHQEEPVAPDRVPSPKPSPRRDWGLEIDIPTATRNLISRGKRQEREQTDINTTE